MKKQIKYLIFLVLLMIPTIVFAAGSMTVSTTSMTLEYGATGYFYVTPTNAAGKVTITSSNTTIATVDKSVQWVESSKLKVNVTGKTSGSTKITVVVDAATFDEEVIKKTYTINVTVKAPKSTNNKLAGLSLSNGTLSPSFNANTTSYTSTIDSSSVTINYSKGDSTQTVTGAGKKTLKYGKNTFKVVVKSEAGTTKTYTIVITRPDNRNSNNNLKTLSVDKGSIAFKSSTTSYSLKVANDVDSIKVSATLDDSKASFVSGYGPRTVKLNYGSNSVLVKVKAENETIKTYTIKVERQDNRSSNNNLKSLSLSAGTIAFSKDVTTYSTTVDYSVTKIDIIAEVEDVKSNYVVNSPSLFVGNNVITVTVTAENGSTKVYIINVVRKEEAAILSDNNNVSSIDILGHGIKFEDGVTEYDVEIGDEYALVIEVLLEDPSANYVIEGNEDLKDGSVIKVTTTSESGQQKEYKINVNKKIEATETKGDKSLLFGIVGFVLGVVTMLAITFILNRAKNSKVKAVS